MPVDNVRGDTFEEHDIYMNELLKSLKTADEDGITGVPKSYVPAWFEIDMYFLAYHNFVKPVLGMNFWPDQSMYSTVLPPKPKKIHGRPRKKKIRSIGEGGSSSRARGPLRDEGVGGSRGGVDGSRGCAGRFRGCAGGSRGGAFGSRGGAFWSR
ncbi:hypothetical protein Tco_0244947 [Tanacetum coccineum]